MVMTARYATIVAIYSLIVQTSIQPILPAYIQRLTKGQRTGPHRLNHRLPEISVIRKRSYTFYMNNSKYIHTEEMTLKTSRMVQ